MQDEYTGSRAIDRLRASIENRSGSLAEFARFSGIPYRSLQDYLSGKSKPGFDQMMRLAEAGIDLGYVLTGFPTASVDHPSPADIDPIDMGDGTSIPGRHYLKGAIEQITARSTEGMDLQAWVDVWAAAEREVANVSGIAATRRQAAVFAIGAEIAQGVKERLRAIGVI